MKETSSVYLYSKENKELYRETLDQYNDKNCVFSRMLLAHLESSKSMKGPFYQKHLKECKVCQKLVGDFSDRQKKVRALIPIVETPSYLSESIESELKDALTFLKRQESDAKTNVLTREIILKSLREFVFEAPLSPAFMKGLAVAGFSWVFLKIVL